MASMNKKFTDQELKKIVSAFDVDGKAAGLALRVLTTVGAASGDGNIDFAEFLKMMNTYEVRHSRVRRLAA